MRVPFGRELDETSRADHSLGKKMAGAASVADFCVLVGTWKMRAGDDLAKIFLTPVMVGALAFATVAGAGLALMLSLKDVVHDRITRGEPVNPLLRLYLGMGIWSLMAWFPTAFILGILLIMITH